MIFDTVLLTGCSSNIAASISQIARPEGVARRVIGCDCRDDHAFARSLDCFEIMPRADEPDYFDRLVEILRRHDVDAVVPLSDMELRQFLRGGFLDSIDGRRVIAPNALAVRVGLDKFETNRMLVRHGLLAPWTRIAGRQPPLELPCILKPRFGRGGKGVVVVHDVEQYSDVGEDHIWQELVLPENGECTCCVYVAADGERRSISFRRAMEEGITSVAEVVDIQAVRSLLEAIADALQLRGSINVQLRMSADGPKVFEINPRFSSTVEIRNRVGFRDFVWAALECKGEKIEPYDPPQAGIKLYRDPART